jgi:P-type Cu2+ transporter
MNCCAIGPTLDMATLFAGDLKPWVNLGREGSFELELVIPGVASPESMVTIEKELENLPGILSARVNLTGKRLVASWGDAGFDPNAITAKLRELGFVSRPFDPSHAGFRADDAESRTLLKAVAASGFAAANIMLLSVSVWSGADGSTRDLFHWISAAIALPTIAYAGRPFFRSAARALSAGQFNMDVPISLAVCLAGLMSLYETFNHGEVAYFDASVTLLFFLLTGRLLDHLMRARARSAVSQLLSLASSSAMIQGPDGSAELIATTRLQPGMKLLVAAGERFAADGKVASGMSEIDRSLVTGESNPESVACGAEVHAGMLNLTGPLVVTVAAVGQDTFLAEIIRLMAAAEQSGSRFVRLADRLARIYSPAVHILAGLTLAGWLIATHGNWHAALMAAIAVLIITCPCALGLAVPAVQTVASGVLFRSGVMIRDGAALEKLSAIDTIIFDKTGTLTCGNLRLVNGNSFSARDLALAAGLAQNSRHPLSRAICEAAKAQGIVPLQVEDVEELPGHGLRARFEGDDIKLGSRRWCMADDEDHGMPEFMLAVGQKPPVQFRFEDEMRHDAASTIQALKARGLRIEILSGDREAAVRQAAGRLAIENWHAAVTPQEKLGHVEALQRAGRKVLMVGDGLNDAPALAAGYTSMAPSSASDVGRTAADTVFMGESLKPVLVACEVACATQRISIQNFSLAVGYNVLAVPLAMLGYASPLIAAIAMSTSSIIVIANSLRLGFIFRRRDMAIKTAEVAATPIHLEESLA